MYQLAIFNYENNDAKIIYSGGLINCLLELEERCYSYIRKAMGSSFIESSFDDFIYNPGKIPNKNQYFVQKSKHNIYKMKLKRKIVKRGILYNTYKINSYREYNIFKTGKKFMYDEYRERPEYESDNADKFKNVLEQIKEIKK